MTEHAGRRLLRHLHRRGIDSLYLTAGSDFAPLVHAYAQGADGLPQPIACLEENVTVGMAHGRALATGRPQVAMVHVTVGTAKALCGLMNAAHDRTPLVLLAGRNPVTQQGHPASRSMYIHWSQEMFDQGGMVREFVKWDYELRDASQVEEAIDRALAIAMAEPRGPVYLTLPREVLADMGGMRAQPPAQLAIPSEPAPDARTLAQVADLVAHARCPVVIASDVGLHAAAREALAAFAREAGVGVVEANRALTANMDVSHERHLGFDVGPALAHSDLLIVCGAVAPWIPQLQGPAPGCRVVHVGTDALFTNVPFRHFPADVVVTSGYRAFFEALGRELRARGDATSAARSGALQALRDGWLQSALAKGRASGGAITKAVASAALREALPVDAVLVNEYWLDRDLAPTQGHGSYFYQSPAGGLGWGVPAALGVRAAQPHRTVACAVGDGAYVFANPAACHHAAAAYGLPILIAVYNNGRWGAVESSARQVYPELAVGAEPLPLAGYGALPDFAAYARASGGHGETVSDAADLVPALQRCMAAMAGGRHALVNILGT